MAFRYTNEWGRNGGRLPKAGGTTPTMVSATTGKRWPYDAAMGDLLADGAVGLENSSIVGRLLEEISWEGNARKYRDGGRGKENVLTAEVFYPLDFLPRAAFLGEVLARAHGADAARRRVIAEIEEATLSFLPGDFPLANSTIRVQPDVLLTTASTYTFVEAKRIRPSSFQSDQLARELIATVQQAGERVPLLLVILGSPPPVRVLKLPGRVSLEDAITHRLIEVDAWLESTLRPEDLISRIPETLAWTTWADIRDVLAANRLRFSSAPEGLGSSVSRLCDAAMTAIDWHS